MKCYLLIALLLLKAVVLSLAIAFGGIELSPDEAQYWTWGQDLDWGYYSKPPGIAWQMRLTTLVFGNTILGVRVGAQVIGFLLSLILYQTARRAGFGERTAFWCGVLYAFSPLGIYLSLAATTDGGAILFLTLAIAFTIWGASTEKGPNYLLVGCCILIGALFKWTAFIFWPLLVPSLFFFKNLRKWNIFWGIALSLIALLPSIYWNASHDWATFRHVGTTVGERRSANFLDFLMTQIGLISPIYCVLLVMGFLFLKKEKNQALWMASIFPLASLMYLGASFFKKIQPNWAAYLYPPSFLIAAWAGCEKIKNGKIVLYLGTALSIGSVAFMFTIPFLQKNTSVSLSYALNPFRQMMGWEKIAPSLLQAGFNSTQEFLFADKYQAASLLSFYSPGQKRAYYFNISETRKNQFSYWPQMQEKEIGKTGYFVVLENTDAHSVSWYSGHYLKRLSPYFEDVHYKGAYPLFSVSGEGVKYMIVFKCINYQGTFPQQINKF